MHKTKNDLCFDGVKLDYQCLIDVARYTLANTANVLITKASTIRDYLHSDCSGTAICIIAQHLPATVEMLIVAAETHNALVEGITRADKQLVNIPTQ